MSNYNKNGDETPKNEIKTTETKKRNRGQHKIDLHKEIEPWEEPVNGQALFNTIVMIFKRHLVLQKYSAETLALWAIFSYCLDANNIAPKLLISSPDKRCGKSTLLEILMYFLWKPIPASNITTAALFRTIENIGGTIVIDEADTFISNTDEMRGIINSGHRKSQAYVIRCDGDKHDPRPFSTWTPMVIAMIGKPADTIIDRSIIIEMRRKRDDEKIVCFNSHKEEDSLLVLARKIMRWSDDNFEKLCEADPIIPEGLNDRAQDNWRPLLAIAELIGPQCLKTARLAVIEHNKHVEDKDDLASIETMLLSDIRDIFEEKDTNKLFSFELIMELCNMEDRPWAEYNRGHSIRPYQISKRLKPYGIRPKKIRIGYETKQGYALEWFKDAFSRYLGGTSEQSNEISTLDEGQSGTVPDHVLDDDPLNTLKNNDCSGVPDDERVPVPDKYKLQIFDPDEYDGIFDD